MSSARSRRCKLFASTKAAAGIAPGTAGVLEAVFAFRVVVMVEAFSSVAQSRLPPTSDEGPQPEPMRDGSYSWQPIPGHDGGTGFNARNAESRAGWHMIVADALTATS